MTLARDPVSQKILCIEEAIAAAIRTFHRSRKNQYGRTNTSGPSSLPTQHQYLCKLLGKHSQAYSLCYLSTSPTFLPLLWQRFFMLLRTPLRLGLSPRSSSVQRRVRRDSGHLLYDCGRVRRPQCRDSAPEKEEKVSRKGHI